MHGLKVGVRGFEGFILGAYRWGRGQILPWDVQFSICAVDSGRDQCVPNVEPACSVSCLHNMRGGPNMDISVLLSFFIRKPENASNDLEPSLI